MHPFGIDGNWLTDPRHEHMSGFTDSVIAAHDSRLFGPVLFQKDAIGRTGLHR
jgi:hypothetical protein